MTALLRHRLARLGRAERGVAMLEFCLGLPIVLAMGGYGIELGAYAVANLRINQIALNLADNASRIGSSTGQASYQVTEADLDDILLGAWRMGQSKNGLGQTVNLWTNGRITISSLENVQRSGTAGFSDHADDAAAVQRLHWQRCLGARGGTADPGYDSSYGTTVPSPVATDTNATTAAYANRGKEMPAGFGSAPLVNAPAGSAAIFVEVNYQYQPLFGTMFIAAKRIHYTASFIVRDTRDYTMLYNPQTLLGITPPRATCNLYSANPATS